VEVNDDSNNENNKDQSNLAKSKIAQTTKLLVVFARWKQRNDTLAAICNCTFSLGAQL